MFIILGSRYSYWTIYEVWAPLLSVFTWSIKISIFLVGSLWLVSYRYYAILLLAALRLTPSWSGVTLTKMNSLFHDRWVAGVLSAALLVSFILCVISDLGFSATLNNAGVVLPASTGIMALGMSWLVGHGLHGATVIAVPLFFLIQDKAAAAVEDTTI